MGRIIKRLSVIVVKKTRAMTVDADESLQGVKLVKLFNLYSIMESSFRENCTVADFTNRKKSLVKQWQNVIVNFFLIASIMALILINRKYSFVTISLMLTFLYTMQKLYASLAALNNNYSFFSGEIPRLNRIMEFFSQQDVFSEESGSLIREKLLKDNIFHENIYLSYETYHNDDHSTSQSETLPDYISKKVRNNKIILDNINLEIKHGQTIALVGESGSGKTSLANLIVRLYDPTEGKIYIDGVDIREFDLTFLRERIGFVNQDNILFNKSVKENILFGRDSASEQEMIVAAQKAHVHEFVSQMSGGYETLIGDRGVKLSGGQRQRLNIAQVFLKKPEIMILDEATSALDSKSEEYIKDSINKISQYCTSIIIAHRLTTVKHADKVVVLDKGRIVEEGDWLTLMKSKDMFYSMVQRQLFKEKTDG